MSLPLILILASSAIIVVAGLIFRKWIARVPVGYGLALLAGVLLAVGAERVAKGLRDLREKLPG